MTTNAYPLTTQEPYPRNQWWVAAYSDEVGHDLLARDILGEPVILYRARAGEVVAVAGICPHRAFPLAKGRLVGDALQCGYHGFEYGPDGSCLRAPSQSGVPTKSALRRYPVEEMGGLIWIWTGAADKADPALLPDLGAIGLGRGDWAVEQHPLATVEARYTLLIENLLDLSHVTFIHDKTIPGGEKVVAIPVSVIETPESITVQRRGENMPLNPLLAVQFPDQKGPVHQHFDAEYLGPCLIRTGGAMIDAQSGAPLGIQNYLHIITPASPTRLHYFVNTTRDFGIDRPQLGDMQRGMGSSIQPEDIDAIESIERVLQSGATLPMEISAKVDNGALKVRRRLEAQIRAEAA
ncbi:aromatic ring-hydroxylating dioxygenase subunit alpha [Novosphingobium sp. ST904]|uniref:aromatic ring-hydroxylating dioxygenase subunit alpha n=1 Tax=Novosphingobium sp. ST904 TaxID=1684385 RepID=UPI0006C86AC6|nr:aromatic ring-hydroxylating dioxygenase subunit alpha [Novosphingobium sp. ST904]TCM27171.1 vanillate O-demethylase monooxygenase subunit [Novosphingobium sp. ST904]